MSTDQKEPDHAAKATRAKKAFFDSLALALLSVATVGTAWCSYQAAVWSAVSQRSMNLSAAASRRGAAAQLQAYQMGMLDVLLFSQHINARAASNDALARFYAERFRSEAKAAFEAWMATHPFENPDAPPHPFVTNLYRPHLLTEARLAEDEAQQLWQRAGEAGKIGRNYVLITVLLASALFCGGTASKFEKGWMHQSVLLLGVAVFLFAATRLLLLPVNL